MTSPAAGEAVAKLLARELLAAMQRARVLDRFVRERLELIVGSPP